MNNNSFKRIYFPFKLHKTGIVHYYFTLTCSQTVSKMIFRVISNVSRILTLPRNYCTNSEKPVIVQKIGFVTTIGINRPEKRNCVDSHTAKLLKLAVEDFENDDSSYAGVLYGTGGNFCAGYDLSELSNVGEETINLSSKDGTMGPTLRFIKKPMVAAVNGYAVAGGLELSLMCDLRVMEDTAIMGVYCRRFGVPLIDGGTVRLPAIVGFSRALDMILTGRSVNAKEAFEWGLANRIVACGTALGQAINLATSLVKFPQECLKADRRSAYNAMFATKYSELLDFERNNGMPIIAQESVQGAQRFMSGVGRHGTTHNLTDKEIPEWEAEENKICDYKNKL